MEETGPYTYKTTLDPHWGAQRGCNTGTTCPMRVIIEDLSTSPCFPCKLYDIQKFNIITLSRMLLTLISFFLNTNKSFNQETCFK